MNRRLFLALLALGAAFPVAAQDVFPSRTLTAIVPFPPGGIADLIGRPLAAALEKPLRQSVIITNRTGAAGAVGNAAAANAKPDGYTIVTAINSVVVIPEADKLFNRKPAFTLDQLAPIALISADPVILVVHSSLPVKSMKELIAFAKTKPNQVSYSSSGIYGALHVPFEMFTHAAGIRMRHIPTTGGGPALTTLLGGHAEASCGGTAAVESHVKSGRLRALASWGAKRHPGMADVVTMKESGLDVEYYLWFGLMAPAGVPDAVMKVLREATRAAVGDSDFKNAMTRLNTIVQYQDAPDYAKFLEADQRKMSKVVAQIGKVEDKK